MLLDLTDYSSEPLHEQIARQLRSRILDGSVDPEAVLLPRRFAREQRVSITSVERAFASLVADGLLQTAGQGGFRVGAPSEESRRDLVRQQQFEAAREEALSAKELELAREIQCRLLPPPRLEGPGWTVVARNEPARFVAGDFYDLLRHADGSVDLVVADVSGKGIGPSLIMASVKAVLPFLGEGRPVVDVLFELNQRLCGELGRREFVALTLVRYQPASGRLELANAGLPDPYLVRASGDAESRIRVLEAPGERLPLGLRREIVYSSLETGLDPGDRLLLVSDGLPEAATDSGDPYGYERLLEHLHRCLPRPKDERTRGAWARLASRALGRSGELSDEAEALSDDPAARPGDVGAWLDSVLDGLRRETALVQPDDWTAMALERRR